MLILESYWIYVFAAVMTVLTVLWVREIGFFRGVASGLLRVLWLCPIFLFLFPHEKTTQQARSFETQKVSVFIDDSKSMQTKNIQEKTDRAVGALKEECLQLGCQVQIDRLSEMYPKEVTDGYSPLKNALESWFQRNQSYPWVLLSDGGEQQPQIKYLESKVPNFTANQGFIASLHDVSQMNFAITRVDAPEFFFDGKPISITIYGNRSGDDLPEVSVQLQVSSQLKSLGVGDIDLAKGQKEFSTTIILLGMKHQKHMLEVSLIPLPGESALWDNRVFHYIDILPNTLGVLHLLGAPSWDGRFVRRFLKSEPKFDLISFYILRDPRDDPGVDERELSLIPFPTDRLFNQELSSFKVVVMQNFHFSKFLRNPLYQRNLVKFVKDGGGLFFIGGIRALSQMDLSGSPLAEILPFEVTKSQNSGDSWLFSGGQTLSKNYKTNLKYKVKMANPTNSQRKFANIYDKWFSFREYFENAGFFTGMHQTDEFRFPPEKSTPLLSAEKPDGSKIPLAVASYPGKGRALWLFSDQFWQYSMRDQTKTPRIFHSKFMQSSMTWLLGENFEKPMRIKNLILDGSLARWQFEIEGESAKYLDKKQGVWKVKVCDQEYSLSDMNMKKMTDTKISVSGEIEPTSLNRKTCGLSVGVDHPAFGRLQESSVAPLIRRIGDDSLGSSTAWMLDLTLKTKAKYYDQNEKSDLQSSIVKWLSNQKKIKATPLPPKVKIEKDYYWQFKVSWIWLCLFAIPLEVLVRRWKKIFG